MIYGFKSKFDNTGVFTETALEVFANAKKANYPECISFCSLREMQEHFENIKDITSRLVSWGKKNIEGFPDLCCGISSWFLLHELQANGYLAALKFNSMPGRHAYNGIPFSIAETSSRGVIVTDPTYQQLWHSKVGNDKQTFVLKPDNWRYVTNWLEGTNLVPSEIVNVRTQELDFGMFKLKKYERFRVEMETFNFEKYIKRCFSKPINADEIGQYCLN